MHEHGILQDGKGDGTVVNGIHHGSEISGRMNAGSEEVSTKRSNGYCCRWLLVKESMENVL